MMSLRNKLNGMSMNESSRVNGGSGGGGEEKPENWEKRPSGMLVQKRIDTDQPIKLPPTIRVRVKYGLIYHEIHISSQATFGELKKMLTGPTGLHHEDQKVFYKKKERDSKQFLDVVGVKDKSKLVLEEDPISQEKRYYETRRNAKMEKAAKAVSEISLVVDKLAGQVSALESVILKGGRVPEKVIVNAIELLMNELVKLDGIPADGDVKLQRKMQVSRVQKYVETLDVLKAKNSMPAANEVNTSNQKAANGGKPPLPPKQLQKPSLGHSPLRPQQQQTRDATPETLVTTQWEMFDSTPPLIALSPTRSPESTSQKPEKLMFPWELLE
ncbi:BAG family molecular chaperone regulator 3-like [Silene latifolia]|uniref:BAG family molecular chaperone regulator 3-like n=1 Tax=Silene latifolia TaxID=37657 RepID=UPI003D7776BF